jgi:hypothetical protein
MTSSKNTFYFRRFGAFTFSSEQPYFSLHPPHQEAKGNSPFAKQERYQQDKNGGHWRFLVAFVQQGRFGLHWHLSGLVYSGSGSQRKFEMDLMKRSPKLQGITK